MIRLLLGYWTSSLLEMDYLLPMCLNIGYLCSWFIYEGSGIVQHFF